jgi:ATP-dependent helicase/nuclease subunit A
VDLLIRTPAGMVVIDFKTDAPPQGASASAAYPGYVAQVAAYARLLAAAGLEGGKVQSALLFTADGSLHWS